MSKNSYQDLIETAVVKMLIPSKINTNLNLGLPFESMKDGEMDEIRTSIANINSKFVNLELTIPEIEPGIPMLPTLIINVKSK